MDRTMTPSLPDAFLDDMRKMLGNEYPAFLRALDESPALALRLNPARAGAEASAEYGDAALEAASRDIEKTLDLA